MRNIYVFIASFVVSLLVLHLIQQNEQTDLSDSEAEPIVQNRIVEKQLFYENLPAPTYEAEQWTAVGDLIVPAGCPWPAGFGNNFIGFRAALLLAYLSRRNLV